MNPTDLLAALHTAERLKDTTRHCCTSHRRPESVAEHSWRIALMAFWLRDEFPQADMDRVIRMCLIHDLGECFTGDIPTFRKTAEDEVREERLLHEWVDTLPAPYGTEMRALGVKDYQFAILVFAVTLAVSGVGLLIYRAVCRRHDRKQQEHE